MKLVTRPTQQYDPRQQKMWDFYINPQSETFGSVVNSGIKAGYPAASSRTLSANRWFKLRKEQMERKGFLLSDAEKVLAKTLRYKTETEVEEKGKKIVKISVGLLSVQVEAAKHVTKTLGKDHGWAERVEQTGKDGAALPSPILNVLINQRNKPNNADAREDPRRAGGNISEQDSIDSLIPDSSGTE